MKTKPSRARQLPIVLLLFAACRSASHDGRGPGGADDSVTVQGHLTASTTPLQALSGRIVVPSTTYDFTSNVSTVGDPSVGHDGLASYRIPLWVPDGVAGMQPSLGIEYNSEGGIGLLGPRWGLTGLSAITRCGTTFAQDVLQTVVNFFGDTFCMDGQRLVRLPGTDEFRTERESYSKILALKDGNGDFITFTVYRKDGQIWHYGRTPSSRLHGNAMLLAGGTTRDVSYAYYVDKIEDRYANSILITYANAVPAPTTGVSQVQELEPAKIAWGSQDDVEGRRWVTFEYDQSSIPAGSTVDTKHLRWVHGLGIGTAQYLTAINVYGPDGLGGVPRLKQYWFTYSSSPATRTGTPLITGEQVLSTVTEGDPDNRAAKRSTQIEWEAGSLAYTRTPFNVPDIFISSYKGPPTPNGVETEYNRQYRRIAAVDLNRDGRDDLVYRSYVVPHHGGFRDCLGWTVRTSQFQVGSTSGIPSLSLPTQLTMLGSDPDTSCRAYLISSGEYQNAKAPNAYVGDIVFADLNGDGYPDIVSPIGKGGYDAGANKQYSYVAGYRAYLSTPAAGVFTFGNPINFLDSVGQPPSIGNFSAPKDATIAIGDTWGDGLPLVITRAPGNMSTHFVSAKLDGRGLVAKSETRGGQTFPYSECPVGASCYFGVPDAQFLNGTGASEYLATIDLDGDGVAEIVRSAPSCPNAVICGAMNGAANVQSLTMNGLIPFPPGADSFGNEARWFADLNGDGLPDVVFGAFESYIAAAINTGAGFGAPIITHFPKNVFAFDSSLRKNGRVLIADVNLDGRQDVISTDGKIMIALLSDGVGGFSLLDTTIPPGALDTSVRQNIGADLNGDGLPDILNLEGADFSPSSVVGYIRQGQAPMMVTKVTEGTGRTIEFGYDVTSGRDARFYSASSSLSCDKDPQHLECLNRGRWLVRSLKVGGSDIAAPTTQTFTYKGGVSDKHGRGFLGFVQRDIYGPGSRHETITYDPVTRLEKPITGSLKPYMYPYALLPLTDRLDVDTLQGANRHHYELATYTLAGGWLVEGNYWSRSFGGDDRHYDCPTTSGSSCSGSARMLSFRKQVLTFDAFGNVATAVTSFYDSSGNLIRTDSDAINYMRADTTNWLVSLLDPTVPSTRTSSVVSPAETVTRTISFTPDTIHGGISSVEIEPSGDTSTHLIRTFERDPRGRLASISEQEVGTGRVRTTEAFYDNIGGTYDGDAVHATTIRRNSGSILQTTRFWRHPGYGFVVEVDDPNGLAATRSYDTFGRLVSETEISGASTTIEYLNKPDDGIDLAIYPEGESTRMIRAHLDSWGRDVWRTSPVDASRALEEDLAYDAFGRVQTRTVKSGPFGAATTVLNTYSFTYDDLDRLTADCHLASDNETYCATNLYDGLQITATDEAGRVVTHIADALGRPSIQRAVLSTGSSDTTFTYGPFDLLETRTQSDATGRTGIAYDVLGRQTSLERTDTGTRVTSYDAFGDVVGISKKMSDGTKVDSVRFGRDNLGRVTSITGGVDRSFYWDAPAESPTTAAPHAIGKLVEVDENVDETKIHYDYDANGMLFRKSWTVGTYGTPHAVSQSQFLYDGQGRISQLTYPTQLANPVSVHYDYDPYNGQELAITDLAYPATPIWSATARNELGQITNESMTAPGGATVARVTSYFLQNGLTKTANLNVSNAQSQIAYTYDPDGLPSTIGISDAGTNENFGFAHDNLGRLTHWQALGTVVNFTYDSDGNLMQRTWSGETVNYDKKPGARTVTVMQGGVTVRSDSYQFDLWGRIIDAPAVKLTYNPLDEITGITEKGSGQFDSFRRDAFGNRIYTGFGNAFNGAFSELLTFDDLYEYRSSNTAGQEERCRIRAGGRLVGEIVRTSDASRTATFYLTDNVGSVVAEASGSGAITTRPRRDPFGNLISDIRAPYLPAEPTGADPDGSGRMGFGDHPLDRNWGLVDMVSRFYSPRLGRFISPDKILPDAFDRTQHNAFAYVGNSPAALRDPFGFCGKPEEEPCPLPPVPPVSGGGVGGGTRDKPDPQPKCNEANNCVSGPSPTPQAPLNTTVNRLNGAAMAGATSPNAAKTAGMNRSSGATGGWADTNEDGTERIPTHEARLTICFTVSCAILSPVVNAFDDFIYGLYTFSGAASPAFNPDSKSRAEAGRRFGQHMVRNGVMPVGSMGNPLARGIAGQRVLTQNIVDDVARLGLRGADAAAARQNAFKVIDKIGTDGLKTLPDLQQAFPNSRVHELFGNYNGWTSVDLVPGNPYAFDGGRLLVKRASDGWEFMIRDTH